MDSVASSRTGDEHGQLTLFYSWCGLIVEVTLGTGTGVLSEGVKLLVEFGTRPHLSLK